MVHACQTFRRVLFNLVLVEVDLSDLFHFLGQFCYKIIVWWQYLFK